MKQCIVCLKELNEVEFIYNNKDYKTCFKCRENKKEYLKKYYEKFPYKLIKYRKTIKNNINKAKKRAKKYRENNLLKIREYDKLYKRKNKQKYSKYRKDFYLKNKNKIKEHDLNRILIKPEYFLFSSARQRARKKSLEFKITQEDIKYLLDTTKECPLRKTPFERGKNHIPNDNSASIDRIDSTKGYLKDNIQIISYRANIIKSDTNLELFEKIINNLKNYKVNKHTIDDNTRKNIIEERQIDYQNCINTLRGNRIKNLERFLIYSAKRRAKKNKLEFNIDENYLKSIFPLNNRCPITGEKFSIGIKAQLQSSATLDRIDSTNGYIKGNVQIISSIANIVKNKLTIEELEFMLKNWKTIKY